MVRALTDSWMRCCLLLLDTTEVEHAKTLQAASGYGRKHSIDLATLFEIAACLAAC